jgi:hypothetical protein
LHKPLLGRTKSADFSSGNTSSWTQTQTGKIKMGEESSLTQKDLYRDKQLFLKFRYENVIKRKRPDPALVQTS